LAQVFWAQSARDSLKLLPARDREQPRSMFGCLDESPPPKELLDDAATDGDSDPEKAAGAGRAALRHRCQAAPKSVACTGVLVCAALVAIAFMRGPIPTQMVGVASVIRGTSLASGVGKSAIVEKTGCNNWHTSSLKSSTTGDADECVDLCRQTPGCVAANFQENECPKHPADMKLGKGACYLMNEDCIEGPNECWTVYKLPENERKNHSFGTSVTRNAGCKNIFSIGSGQSKEFSAFACQHKCETDAECVGFLLKAKGCGSEADDKDEYPCHTLHGDCDEDTSDEFACWDIYYKASSEQGTDQSADTQNLFTFQEDAPKGSTVISLSSPECFLVGDTIQLFHSAEDHSHKYTVEQVDPITISPPLQHEFLTGTGVLRLHYPDNPTHCGDWTA